MQQVVATIIYILTALIPTIFSPGTSELFEFPKFLVLISGSLILLFSWLYYLYQTRDFQIKLNPIGFAIIAVLATQTVSTIFSLHPYTSFWGYYSRFHGGLFSTICYTIIYFIAVKWLDSKSTQKIINISIYTSIFIGVIAILERYNYSLSCVIINYASNLFSQADWYTNSCWSLATNPSGRSFSLLGQPNWLAAYLIPHFFLLVSQIKLKTKTYYSNFIPYFSLAIIFLALIFTRSRSGLLAFAIAYFTYWILSIRNHTYDKIKSLFFGTSLVVLIIASIFGTVYSPSIKSLLSKSPSSNTQIPAGTVLENGGTESGDIRKIVWTGALKSITLHPIIGSGPETFAYIYYLVRPIEHNLTSEWDYLYNKAHNEYLNIASGAGIMGLVAYLYFHWTILATSFTRIPKSKKINQDHDQELRRFYPALGATIISFTITNFFGFSVIPVYFTLILFAIASTTLSQESRPDHSNISPYHYLVFLLLLIYPLRIFLADRTYILGKQNLDVGNLRIALPLLEKAISYRSGLDLFHATLAEAYAQSGKATKAIEEIEINHKLNSAHLNFYRSRAKAYITLAESNPIYYQQASAEVEKALTLAPTDPKLAYNLGLIYTRTDQLDLAEANLRKAIDLKPDYESPYYALALLYEQTNQKSKLSSLMNEVKTNLSTYSAQLREKVEKY